MAVTREQRIIETFVELSDTLVEDFDVIEFLHLLTERCVELLDCAEAGVLLADAAGRLMVMASSSERSDALEVLQIQNDEGPCFECFHRAEPVVSHSLQEDLGRWPVFAPLALEKGFASVQTVPMRVQRQTIGALNLFRADSGAISLPDVPLAQGLADIAAVALLHERTLRESHGLVEQLQGALTSRVIIEQAKGVLATRAHISVDAAFMRIRAYARAHNRRLSDVAAEVIDGRLDPAAVGAAE